MRIKRGLTGADDTVEMAQGLKFETSNWDNVLLCAYCGGNCLHHNTAVVWFREGWEDGWSHNIGINSGDPYVRDVRFLSAGGDPDELPRGEGVQVHRDLPGENPSDRRGAIEILFDCEFCDGVSSLQIIQHKGTTYVHMVKRKPLS